MSLVSLIQAWVLTVTDKILRFRVGLVRIRQLEITEKSDQPEVISTEYFLFLMPQEPQRWIKQQNAQGPVNATNTTKVVWKAFVIKLKKPNRIEV